MKSLGVPQVDRTQSAECRVWLRQSPREGSVKGKVTWGERTSAQTAWAFSAFGDLKSSLYVGESWTK